MEQMKVPAQGLVDLSLDASVLHHLHQNEKGPDEYPDSPVLRMPPVVAEVLRKPLHHY